MSNLLKSNCVDISRTYEMKLDIEKRTVQNKTAHHEIDREPGNSRMNFIGGQLSDAKDEAERILQEARRYANETVEQAKTVAQAEVEQAVREGYEQGHAIGIKEGKAAGKHEQERLTAAKLDEIADLMTGIKTLRAEIIEKQEKELIGLAVEIAKKVVNAELEVNGDVLANIFAGAVKGFVGEEWVKLTISSQDRVFVTSQINKLKDMVKGTHIDVVPLDDAPKGTCVIEFPKGAVDVSPQRQFKNIEKILKY